MKNRIRPILTAFVALTAVALPSLGLGGCAANGSLAPTTSAAVSAGTALAVNKYPGAAPFVEMFAGAVRAYTASGPIDPDMLANVFAPYVASAEALAAKVSPKAAADLQKYATAVVSEYRKAYPALQKGEMSVESFAQAVETGA